MLQYASKPRFWPKYQHQSVQKLYPNHSQLKSVINSIPNAWISLLFNYKYPSPTPLTNIPLNVKISWNWAYLLLLHSKAKKTPLESADFIKYWAQNSRLKFLGLETLIVHNFFVTHLFQVIQLPTFLFFNVLQKPSVNFTWKWAFVVDSINAC